MSTATPTRTSISRPGLLRVYAWVLITASITVLALHGVIGLLGGFGSTFAPYLLALDAGLLILGYLAFEISQTEHRKAKRAWSAPLWLIGPYLVLLCSETGGDNSPFFMLLVVTCAFSGLMSSTRATLLLTALLAAMHGTASWLMPEEGLLRSGLAEFQASLFRGRSMDLNQITSLSLHSAFLFLASFLALRLAGSLSAQVSTLADQAVRDPLTQLSNRRSFMEKMGQELARAQNFSWPMSVLVIDLDHFKQVNDQYGHAFGDQVLQQAAQILRDSVGTIDHLGRVGGEEFSVGAVAAEPNHGAELAMRIIRRFRTHPWASLRPGLQITCSIGVAVLDPTRTAIRGTSTLEELLDQADKVLYKVKEQGRDAYAVFEPGAARPNFTKALGT